MVTCLLGPNFRQGMSQGRAVKWTMMARQKMRVRRRRAMWVVGTGKLLGTGEASHPAGSHLSLLKGNQSRHCCRASEGDVASDCTGPSAMDCGLATKHLLRCWLPFPVARLPEGWPPLVPTEAAGRRMSLVRVEGTPA